MVNDKMYKIVKVPFSSNFPDTIVVRTYSTSIQDIIDFSISVGLSVRKTGGTAAITTTGSVSDLDLSGWVDDTNPSTTIVLDATHSFDTTNTTVVVLYETLDRTNRSILSIDGATSVLGIQLPLELAPVQQKLDSTNDLLLIELEKLLPADNAVRILREKIRNGEI